MINNKKTGSTKEEVKQHLQNKGERNVVGGAGGLGFVGGAGVKVAKGAFRLISSILGRGKKVASTSTKAAKSTSTFKEIANESLRRGLNKGDKINPTY